MIVFIIENYSNKSNSYKTLSTGRIQTRLTSGNLTCMIRGHHNSGAEFDSSKLNGAQHALIACFFVHEFCTSMVGRLLGTSVRRFRSDGLSTRKRLITFFDRKRSGSNERMTQMNTTSVSSTKIVPTDDLIIETFQETLNTEDQMNVLDLVLEATISGNDDSYSTAIVTAVSNMHTAFSKLKHMVVRLDESREIATITPSQQKNVDDLRNITNQTA